jgi:glycogen synthase
VNYEVGRPLRVLFWTDWFLPSIGGVEVFSARLLPALARRGHEITVIAGHHCSGLPGETDFMGVTVRRFLFHQTLAASDLKSVSGTLRQVARLKQELRPDIVHLNTLGPSVLFHLASSRHCPAPVLLTMHSPVMADAERPDTLYGQALRSALWVNCNSHAVHADLCRRVPEMCAHSSVTYYGMDPPALQPTPRPYGDPVVLGLGRLVSDKGFDLAIHAFADVVRRFPRARLLIAGEGAARPELERLVEACGLSDVVEFMGAVASAEVPALINIASLVVVPSRWDEPFGLVALEAALMARPVVAARVGGLTEAVEHGTTGLLVDREDPAALANAMTQLLGDPATADRMGLSARERARRLFAWDRCIDEYERLYELTRHAALPHGGHD